MKKKPDGAVAQPLFVCALDDTPWLSEDEAVAHVLKNHFATFYQAERTATEPPKGTYTFVAQCGMSGVILGPPNHHDYQNQLRKLHAERFSRMPFDVFKSRVKIVKDEAVVKKWVEEQSFKTEYIVLNVPEPLKLPNLEEVEKHFRATHKDTIIKPVETHTGRRRAEPQSALPRIAAARARRNGNSNDISRCNWPPNSASNSPRTACSFSRSTRPSPMSPSRARSSSTSKPRRSRKTSSASSSSSTRIRNARGEKLIETLAPTPSRRSSKSNPERRRPPLPKAERANARRAAEPTPEQTAIIADLHWLVHQGHVIEFADGRLETAKKPAPRPPKPEKKPAEEKPMAEGEAISAIEPVSPAEAVAAPAADLPAPAEARLQPLNRSLRRNLSLRRPMQRLRKRLNRRR